MKGCLASAALIACALGVAGATQQPEQQPVFRGTRDAVRVFATVTDRDGRLVTTLTQDDFEIRDEGKPQPITQFDNTPQPIRLIVMLDVSGSMEGNLPLLRAAGCAALRASAAGRVARVGSFGHDVTISPSFTNDRARAPRRAADDDRARCADAALARDRRGDGSVRRGGRPPPGDSGAERRQGQRPDELSPAHVSQADVIDRARREDVMIYARRHAQPQPQPRCRRGIGPGGLQAMLVADLPDPGLARVAEETGGGYIEIRFGQDLGAAFARVADELHSQYLLAFAPPKRDGKVHEVNVRVTPGGLKTRRKEDYVAPKG